MLSEKKTWVHLKKLMHRLHLDETALDLFARRPGSSFYTRLSFIDRATMKKDGEEAGYRPRQVIEICGASDTPKIQVLEHVIASFVTKSCLSTRKMPKERVFIFDHECQVSATRMAAIVTRRLDDHEQEEAVDEVLSRVQTCNCRDSFQWLASLNHVHFMLLEAPSTPLMLVFNCVGSFHAIDRMAARSVGDGLALSEQVFLFLRQFIQHHSPIVFAAKDIAKNTRNPWEHTEYLPSSWTSQVTKRILLRTPSPLCSASNLKVEKKCTLDEEGSDMYASFEAKCIVAGKSQVYVCRTEGGSIFSSLVDSKHDVI
ncbi:unnamed protein product [Peronospora belbahrii]|uniref:DNA recombination and repair protein Rad51-like C-terminal domain-containing protein n=1 Tax=Peronospora belbahrii TaxID=622444 RepID=A0ABN8DFA9_9STRA|nr:unnamed protein product [Peronospora belbahrii]